MDKALATDTSLAKPQDISSLRSLTGEGKKGGVSIPKIVVDYRQEVDGKPNPGYGWYAIVTSEKKDDKWTKTFTPIEKPFKAVVLKKRQLAKNHDKDLDKCTHFVREFDSWVLPIDVWSAGKKPEVVDSGNYQPMKAKYGLKPYLILYLWYQEDIYRLQLSASSFYTFGDYENLFFDSSVSLAETEFTLKEDRKTPSSPKYFSGLFSQSAEFGYEKAVDLVKQLDEALKIYQANTKIPEEEKPPADMPEVGAVEKVDEIKASDLPF